MIRLFKYDNYEVKVAPEILKIKVFKKLWDRDSSKTKEKAQMELAFIFFFCDPRSDYQYLVDDDERMSAIMDGEGFSRSWKPDKDLQAAMDYYNTFLPESALLLQDTRLIVDKLRSTLRNMNISDLKDIKESFAILKTLPEVIEKLSKTEKVVFEQMHETGEARGTIEKTIYDDGLDNVN